MRIRLTGSYTNRAGRVYSPRDVAPIIHAGQGFSEHQTVGLRVLSPRGAWSLSSAGTFSLPHFVPNAMMPWATKKLRAGETILIPYFPYDLPFRARRERVLGKGVGLRSILAVSSGKHILVCASLKGKLMEFTPKMIERLEWFIRELTRFSVADPPKQEKSL